MNTIRNLRIPPLARRLSLLGVALAAATITGHAEVTVNSSTVPLYGDESTPITHDTIVAAWDENPLLGNNLAQAGVVELLSGEVVCESRVANLNDGLMVSGDPANVLENTGWNAAFSDGSQVKLLLDGAYDITRVDTFTGYVWNRTGQKYDIYTSTDGGSTWSAAPLVSVNEPNTGSGWLSRRVTVTDSLGRLGRGVNALRFDIHDNEAVPGGFPNSIFNEIAVYAAPGAPQPVSRGAGGISIKASAFARGNAEKIWDGEAIRFNESWVEYDLDAGKGGTFDLVLRYASVGERPVRMSLDGTLLNERALVKSSGSWGADIPLRADKTTLALGPGKHVLRLEASELAYPVRSTPHLFDLALSPSSSLGSIPAIRKEKDALLALAGDAKAGLERLPPARDAPDLSARVNDLAGKVRDLDVGDPGTAAKTGALRSGLDEARREIHARRLAALSGPDQSKVVVWVGNPLVKVFKDDLLPGKLNTTAISIEACRNESEPAQICITSGKYKGPLEVEVAPLVHSSGTYTLPEVNSRFVGYVEVQHGKEDLRKKPALFPDPLLLDKTVSIEPGQNQPVWLTVKVPKDAPPGDYRAEVTVKTANDKVALPLNLKVYPAVIPEKINFWLGAWGGDIWQAGEAGIAVNAGDGKFAYPPEFFSFLREETLKNRREHRATAYSDLPTWNVFDGLIKVCWKDGAYDYDFSAFDKYVSAVSEVLGPDFKIHCVAFGCKRAGEGKGLLASVPVFRADGTPDPERSFTDVPAADPRYLAFIEDVFKIFGDHLRAKGWLDHFYFKVMDETNDGPALDDVRRLAGILRKAVPGIRQNGTIGHDHMLKENYLDLAIAGSWLLDRYPEDVAKAARREGREVWSYNEHRGMIDGPLIYPRLIGWRAWLYGLKGYSHWAWAYATNAMQDPNSFRQSYSADLAGNPSLPGENFLVYFDKDRKKIVDSLRWEMLRETAEDYETLLLLEKAGGDSSAYCRRLIRKDDGYDVFETDPDKIQQVRRDLLGEIARRIVNP